ncbi:MAG: 2,3-diphosphoglycerate-dependent phosphoglycerate mutase [Bacteroides sp.]|nr:2,3-diphosphoglycerate-dependent phosphoglycerate mutase [Bacteroides sp.]
MSKLILVRHGESEWNSQNRFTGWADVKLSEKGKEEARQAGKRIREAGLLYDLVFSSVLTRAIQTQHLLQEEAERVWVPEFHHWRLNERHYGALQGLNKAETAEKYGDEQVHIWRRSFDVVPPLLEEGDERAAWNEDRYKMLDRNVIPRGESLELTIQRVLPFWQDYLAPALLDNKTVLVVAHGNSLRALVKYLDRLNDEEIVGVEIPTGIPQVYELDEELNKIKSYYLK